MGLLIQQGHHDPSNDGNFKPIVSPRETAQITNVEEHKYFDNAINVAFKIIGGENDGKKFFDGVTYDPNDKMGWKYVQFRNAAGVPYSKEEDTSIDIEELLLDRVVNVELSQNPDKKDPSKFYQRVKYLKPDGPAKAQATPKETGQAPAFSATNDLPELNEDAGSEW